ncbi:type II secretion system protein [Pseudanabaena biceps]|nr:type II secretion system protein [Pseudanabaena biceps]
MKGILKKIVSSWRKNISQYISIYMLRSPKHPVKRNRRDRLTFGFTLIELLVAALIASLLVSVLLGFLIGVLDSDRKETAKSNAQEELQAAISYISDDLQEAIYIYGADSLSIINSQLPHTQSTSTSSDCNPTSNTCTPILVFWKRYNFNPNATGKYTSTGTSEVIGCMPYSGDATILAACKSSLTGSTGASFGRDTYTYSLVAYYLKNDTSLTGNTWSNTARILRWELKDGYSWYCGNNSGSITSTTTNGVTTTTPPTGCPTSFAKRATSTSPLITSPVTVDNTYYFIVPDKGFTRPDFASAGSLSSLASGWKKFDNFDFSTNPFTTLVDFMDDTALADVAYDGNNTTKEIKIPIGANTVLSNGISINSNCDDPSIGVGNTNPASETNLSGTVTQRIPANFSDATNPAGLSSFYACVAPENVTVRLYMRGNAIARLTTPVVSSSSRKPTANNLTFFPTADVRSFGRSGIGLKN